jgi:hypothetical protein
MSEQNERYEVEHGGDADHGGTHRPAIAPRPEEPSACGSDLECPDVLHQALNFPISLFQFFNFSIFWAQINQSMGGGGVRRGAPCHLEADGERVSAPRELLLERKAGR